jgi:high-affinity Fe2+/Pb2+ permease
MVGVKTIMKRHIVAPNTFNPWHVRESACIGVVITHGVIARRNDMETQMIIALFAAWTFIGFLIFSALTNIYKPPKHSVQICIAFICGPITMVVYLLMNHGYHINNLFKLIEKHIGLERK